MFCTFTCSPDQSLFVNVTRTAEEEGKLHVTELDTLVSSQYASGFYDSCKDVKFGALNGKAMDLIGGGATNYSQFLKFLGDKKPLGSPFQINFPNPGSHMFPGMKAMDEPPKSCSDESASYRCACVDCAKACQQPPEVDENGGCFVGLLPCLSFAAILVYSLFIMVLILAVSYHVMQRKHAQLMNDRLRLLQDATSDDDNEYEGPRGLYQEMLDGSQASYRPNAMLHSFFVRLGRVCARFPALTITVSVLIVLVLNLGWMNFAVETDPVRLWVSPNAPAAKEKAFFDSHFGPFFRVEQAFLVNDTGSGAPVLSYGNLRWWFEVESRVRRLKSIKRGATLDSVCYRPTGDACVVQSISGYFGGPSSDLDPRTWQETIAHCTEYPVDCLPDFQQPLKPSLVLGGWKNDVLDAQALIVTWVVANHEENTPELSDAMDWEASLKSLLLAVQEEAADRGLRLSFNTEISLEQELNKSTNTDAKIVVISYIIMFIYASIALGSSTFTFGSLIRNPMNALVHSKFGLGVVGILIVLMSVSASVGLFSAAGVRVTLIIAEVIPFLILAVGVDNIFLLSHELERVNTSHANLSVPDRVAKALGGIGPSILLSATTETVAFSLGTLAGMPAVRNFAAYAAGAVLINAVLQVTLFVSILTLNQMRVEANRADCIPCVRVKRADHATVHNDAVYGSEEGFLDRFIRKVYAPTLLGTRVKVAVSAVFLAVFAVGIALIPYVRLGLDQRIAIPSDSYLIPYFNDLDDYFEAGPPVYFVTSEVNVTDRERQIQLCGRFAACSPLSLTNILEQERKRPETSYIADPTASWLDDYFSWLNPSLSNCCVNGNRPCFQDRDPPWNTMLHGMPVGQEFLHYLGRWLTSPTTEQCPLAGKAAYGDAVVVDMNRTTILASHFRTSHTPLHSQQDYIGAYQAARRVADRISTETGVEVFPYSKFYIFFDQYNSIVRLTAVLIASAVACIFVLTAIILGSVRTAIVVAFTVVMIVVDIIGAMAVAGVSLNAVSLVNLVICVGIAVEFCAHIARAFTFPSLALLRRAPRSHRRSKDLRAWTALVHVGGSVFTGITITKLLGVTVLAFTRSKIFEIYYFRIWLALIIFAATHALVFIPVALSVFGGTGKPYFLPAPSSPAYLWEQIL